MNSPLLNLIDESYPEAVRLRRIIHANPELSGEEFETATLVYEYLSRLGLTPRYYAGKTGVAITLVDWDELDRWSGEFKRGLRPFDLSHPEVVGDELRRHRGDGNPSS